MHCQCIIFFENPFWVGIFERNDEEECSVSRFVFGVEPTDPELIQFVLHQYHTLTFSAPCQAKPEEHKTNFKRQQRLNRQLMSQSGIGTFSQRMLKTEYERLNVIKSQENKKKQEALKEEKFQIRQKNKKEKHRGH